MGSGLAVAAAALAASALTFFTGFGLGTLLMPVFALFFPVETAVALTAVVHFLNNVFKLGLIGRHAEKEVLVRFGFPAMCAAYLGAQLLVSLGDARRVIGGVMMLFAVGELAMKGVAFDRRWMPVGGVLSGFFGGLSGHQGALRSAFLIRLGLTKESFVATGVVIACLVDVTRLAVYGSAWEHVRANGPLMLAAVSSAFAGAWLGRRLLHKVTIAVVERVVAALLFTLGAGLALRWI